MIEYIAVLLSFVLIASASKHISSFFVKVKLPKITGFLFVGILAGPFVLNLLREDTVERLDFINEASLAFIAFAAGAELYLKELRSRYKSIKWMTFGQLVVTVALSTAVIWLIADSIPFIKESSPYLKFSVALLAAVIFAARSPASAIAVISEMRAKGPFTQTVMGVTVVKDVLVIVLFAISFSVAKTLLSGEEFGLLFILKLAGEIILSAGLGIAFGKLIAFLLSLKMSSIIKNVVILLIGYSAYVLSHFITKGSDTFFGFEFYTEPLLICITASFFVINYSKFKNEFHKVIREVEPVVYVVFFTLTGAGFSVNVLPEAWFIALLFFAVRLMAMILGAYIGGKAGGDPIRLWKFGWMPYITQAGVGIGLVTVVAAQFTDWGNEFAAVMISVIIVNQLIGPPLFKWVLNYVGESRVRAETHEFDGIRDAIIFGLEDQSLALARQLKDHGWEVKVATKRNDLDAYKACEIDIVPINDFSLNTMDMLHARKAEAIVAMKSDEENLEVCEIAYEQFGTKDLVVRLNRRENFEQFHELGALIVEPSTAIVSLLDHLVRSPVAASLLLGFEEDQDTVDIEVSNRDIHGLALRDLQLPGDVLILSINRKGNTVLSHGYTRLRKGDIVTVVGSEKSLEQVMLRFEQ